jgi:hypothetical protein
MFYVKHYSGALRGTSFKVVQLFVETKRYVKVSPRFYDLCDLLNDRGFYKKHREGEQGEHRDPGEK